MDLLTTPSSTRALNLPPQRVVQLKEIMSFCGHDTLTATVAELIRTFAAMHQLPLSIDGVEVHRAKDGVLFILDGVPPLTLSREQAREFVATIRAFARGERRGGMIETGCRWGVSRRGNGVRLALADGNIFKARAFTLDVSLDIAAAIEAAAEPRQH